MNNKDAKTNKKFKIAYAFVLLLAIGALMFSKVATEKSLGKINSLENNTTQKTVITTTEPKTEVTVRQNVTDVPDTRNNS